MTKLIVETDSDWARKKIADAIHTEAEILHRAIDHIQDKLKHFEAQYGAMNRNALYEKVDDMELIEWEGERETLDRLKVKLKSLEEIAIEYR